MMTEFSAGVGRCAHVLSEVSSKARVASRLLFWKLRQIPSAASGISTSVQPVHRMVVTSVINSLPIIVLLN